MRTHSGEKPYQCAVCSKNFTSGTHLAQHKQRVHSTTKQHPCKLCGAQFSCKDYLLRHYRNHHQQRTRDHKCSYCDKEFYDKAVLQRHIRIHTGEKPYKCKICNAAFSQSQLLPAHIKKVHGDMYAGQTFPAQHESTQCLNPPLSEEIPLFDTNLKPDIASNSNCGDLYNKDQ